MRNIIFDRRRAERFAQLLDEAEGGPRHHGRSRSDDQLAELVALGHGLTSVPSGAEIAPDFRAGLRAMLVATAEREGIGHEADAAEARTPVARLLKADAAGRRLRARGAVVIGVIAGAVAVSGMSAASSDANPGDALYTVKRQTESARLALAGSDEDRGRLFLEFASTRLREARAVAADTTGLEAVLHDMDSDTREGMKLLSGAATRKHSTVPLRPVDPFVEAQRKQIGGFLDTLSGPGRDRALDSLILLDSVGKRSRALAAGLACPAPEGLPQTDALGPLPNVCGDAPADDPVGSPVHGGSSQRAQDQVADRQPTGGAPATGTTAAPGTPAPAATVTPSVAADADAPGDDSEPVTEVPRQKQQQPSPVPSPTPDDGNVLEDLLGGLLGG